MISCCSHIEISSAEVLNITSSANRRIFHRLIPTAQMSARYRLFLCACSLLSMIMFLWPKNWSVFFRILGYDVCVEIYHDAKISCSQQRFVETQQLWNEQWSSAGRSMWYLTSDWDILGAAIHGQNGSYIYPIPSRAHFEGRFSHLPIRWEMWSWEAKVWSCWQDRLSCVTEVGCFVHSLLTNLGNFSRCLKMFENMLT